MEEENHLKEVAGVDDFVSVEEWFCVLRVVFSKCGDISGQYIAIVEDIKTLAEAMEFAHYQGCHLKWKAPGKENGPEYELKKINVQGRKGLGPFPNARKVVWLDFKKATREDWQVELLKTLAITM